MRKSSEKSKYPKTLLLLAAAAFLTFMLCCVGFGALVGASNAEPWQKVVMFVLYFGYGILNALER